MRIVFMNEKINVLDIDDTFQAIMSVLDLPQVDYRIVKENIHIFSTTEEIESFFQGRKGKFVFVAKKTLGFDELTDNQIEGIIKFLGELE